MIAFFMAHEVAFSAFGIAAIDFALDVFHPNASVTNILNLILPFLRKSAGQAQ